MKIFTTSSLLIFLFLSIASDAVAADTDNITIFGRYYSRQSSSHNIADDIWNTLDGCKYSDACVGAVEGIASYVIDLAAANEIRHAHHGHSHSHAHGSLTHVVVNNENRSDYKEHIPIPSGYQYCHAKANVLSSDPGGYPNKSYLTIYGHKTALDTYISIKTPGNGAAGTSMILYLAIEAVRDDKAEQYRGMGRCAPVDYYYVKECQTTGKEAGEAPNSRLQECHDWQPGKEEKRPTKAPLSKTLLPAQ